LALLRAVDADQADAFRVLVVQEFDGVTVYYPDYFVANSNCGSLNAEAQN